MQNTLVIRKIAVLGAGVMGAQIAAHCANSGFKTYLYDLKKEMAEKAISDLAKLKPAPLACPDRSVFIQAKNYEEHLDDLRQCDLIIEAIAEREDWKEGLYRQIAPFIHENAVLASNTSGLSINALCQILPSNLQKRFCGIHFFNPPRYMHLVELVPSKHTPALLCDEIETWLTSKLGKGVVRAKDTPNFIANRIGVFSLLATLHHAEHFGLNPDEVDALTGTLIGRPKSATFRTMDVVGLDTMAHVVETMHSQLKIDPWHKLFVLPVWLKKLIAEGHLGQKTGQGIYRKQGSQIEVLDVASGQYKPAENHVSEEVLAILKQKNAASRFQALCQSTETQAQFLAACLKDLFLYSAFHLKEIAHTVRDVDDAMRWGFGWQEGPFETWQHAGVANVMGFIKQSSTADFPDWLQSHTEFYNSKGAFSPQEKTWLSKNDLPVYLRQNMQRDSQSAPVLFENEGLRLVHLKDDVAVLSFKTKANTIGQSILDGIPEALLKTQAACKGLIIHQQDASNFSSGADLRGVFSLIQNKNMSGLEKMVAQFQQVLMQIKYAPFPVVASVRGRALGGGTELLMHCDAVTAAFESYPGLVEAGVGLLPAGGGSKEMALRAAAQAGQADLMVFLQPLFEQIAKGLVSQSATDALKRKFYRESDAWVMHTDEVLFAAAAKITSLLADNYNPPLVAPFRVAGREGHAKFRAGLVNWLEGGFISQHDYEVADKMAYVLCGGEVYQGELVDENWMLKLELEGFMALAENPLTQARIAYMLENGKPLRN